MPRLIAIAGVVDLERLNETVFSFGFSRCRLIPNAKGILCLVDVESLDFSAADFNLHVVTEHLVAELRDQLPGVHVDHADFSGAEFDETAVNLHVAGYWWIPSDRIVQQIAEPLLKLCRGEA